VSVTTKSAATSSELIRRRDHSKEPEQAASSGVDVPLVPVIPNSLPELSTQGNRHLKVQGHCVEQKTQASGIESEGNHDDPA
jgi:hypothetical protein